MTGSSDFPHAEVYWFQTRGGKHVILRKKIMAYNEAKRLAVPSCTYYFTCLVSNKLSYDACPGRIARTKSPRRTLSLLACLIPHNLHDKFETINIRSAGLELDLQPNKDLEMQNLLTMFLSREAEETVGDILIAVFPV
jgi:hypothetical protein